MRPRNRLRLQRRSAWAGAPFCPHNVELILHLPPLTWLNRKRTCTLKLIRERESSLRAKSGLFPNIWNSAVASEVSILTQAFFLMATNRRHNNARSASSWMGDGFHDEPNPKRANGRHWPLLDFPTSMWRDQNSSRKVSLRSGSKPLASKAPGKTRKQNDNACEEFWYSTPVQTKRCLQQKRINLMKGNCANK